MEGFDFEQLWKELPIMITNKQCLKIITEGSLDAYDCIVYQDSTEIKTKLERDEITVYLPNLLQSNRIIVLMKHAILSKKQFFLHYIPLWFGTLSGVVDFEDFGLPFDFYLEMEITGSDDIQVIANGQYSPYFRISGTGFKEIRSGLIIQKGYKFRWFVGFIPYILGIIFIEIVCFFVFIRNLELTIQFVYCFFAMILFVMYITFLYKKMTLTTLDLDNQ